MRKRFVMVQSNNDRTLQRVTTLIYEGLKVQIIERDLTFDIVLGDVCEVLAIKNASEVFRRLEDYEKGAAVINTSTGPREVKTVTEFGLYFILIRSIKPAAKPFFRWVRQEVLPAILKAGRYDRAAETTSPPIATAH